MGHCHRSTPTSANHTALSSDAVGIAANTASAGVKKQGFPSCNEVAYTLPGQAPASAKPPPPAIFTALPNLVPYGADFKYDLNYFLLTSAPKDLVPGQMSAPLNIG